MLANMGIDSLFHFHQQQIVHLLFIYLFIFLSNTEEKGEGLQIAYLGYFVLCTF